MSRPPVASRRSRPRRRRRGCVGAGPRRAWRRSCRRPGPRPGRCGSDRPARPRRAVPASASAALLTPSPVCWEPVPLVCSVISAAFLHADRPWSGPGHCPFWQFLWRCKQTCRPRPPMVADAGGSRASLARSEDDAVGGVEEHLLEQARQITTPDQGGRGGQGRILRSGRGPRYHGSRPPDRASPAWRRCDDTDRSGRRSGSGGGAANASVIGSDRWNGGSVNSKLGFTSRMTASHGS